MRQPRLNVVEGDAAAEDRDASPLQRVTGTGTRSQESVAALQARIAEELARRSVDMPDGEVVAGGDLAGGQATAPPDDDLVADSRRDKPAEAVRIVEALLFAATEPVGEDRLAARLPDGTDIPVLMEEVMRDYEGRGVQLVRVAGKWAFRTAPDLAWLLEKHATEERRLSRAAQETLAIISYHQPITRAEIEEIRGVATSKGTLDVLMETGWVRPRGRRRAPGKPITYGTTDAFLEHFGLNSIRDLPGLSELRGAGLLDANLPPDFRVPEPTDVAALMPDELPLDDEIAEQEELALDEDLGEFEGDAEDRSDAGATPEQS